jgi:hypothetical protein
MGKMKKFPISIRIWLWVPRVFSGVLDEHMIMREGWKLKMLLIM